MIAILIVGCILLAVLFLASDINAMAREAGPSSGMPPSDGRKQLCLTCGEETDGSYYCSEECYPPSEEEEI